MTLGRSWQYPLAGVSLLVSAAQVIRDLRSGACWYFAELLATILWTLWQSGLDYCGWIPRNDLLLLGIAVAACMLTLSPRTPRRGWLGIGAALGVVFVVAVTLAFAPYAVAFRWQRHGPLCESRTSEGVRASVRVVLGQRGRILSMPPPRVDALRQPCAQSL